MTQLIIRFVAAEDKAAWRALYRDYAAFYKSEQTDDMAETVWSWLFDEGHVEEGLVAELDGDVIGLAHFRPQPRPLRAGYVGFLDDLFIDPSKRGSGAAEALMDRLNEIAEERDWSVFRWLTADDNYRARGLYDRVGRKTSWNLYEMD